ncbi:exportin-1 [Drosophila yakuba]|nr:exportin-1 [Drosophila yakuba]XP_039479193.1 exportin-1 [Drosophila santomea]EDW88521.1 emb [Drosophila yakuba]
MATMLTSDEASKLLDFSQKLDINLLDKIVEVVYTAQGEQLRLAQSILTTLKEHPEAWTRVDSILEYSQNQRTKFYALQILEEVIKTRWKVLPRNQCEGIKKYVVSLIIKTSSDPNVMEQNKVYLNKLNMILVHILKREWPRNWETFISDIVGASKTNESLCMNNMVILKNLSEEVFDFSQGQITQTKAKHLKDTMCSEFSQIFTLCSFVLENSMNAALIHVTLETLLRFLNWIPLGYIFETQQIETLIFKFLSVPMFRNVTLKCLSEIAGLTAANYDENFATLFKDTMVQLEQIVGQNMNMNHVFKHGSDTEQELVLNLAMFLCTFLKEHGKLVEDAKYVDYLNQALMYLVMISEVEDVEVFKICLEYWNSLVEDLYNSEFFHPTLESTKRQQVYPRRRFYAPILSKVRFIMISRMAKPEEVLVVENENGEVVREFMKDTNSINLYKNMRETLVFLTHLDSVDTDRIMTLKLLNQVNGSEFSWKNLNTLCWAIGSISGAFCEEDEKRFLVTVIKDLLGLCEQKKGKDNKAIIASNIMYVVGQYPRFLRAHWKFLKTVVNKLFEFMHETHDGVQDMACDTFIKIAIKCRRYFVTIQPNEACTFIDEILTTMSSIICDLQPQQVHTFYEAVGYMISAQVDQVQQDVLIERYMQLPNQVWDDIISRASKNVDFLKNMTAVKQLGSILKTNVAACKALGHAYVIQLGRIYLDMLNVYKITSENIIQAIEVNGVNVNNQPLIKTMHVVKKETLNLISEWVSRSNDNQLVMDNFIPPLLDAILLDYQRCKVPSAREPKVLSAMAIIVHKLRQHITNEVPKIFDAVFECTLDMINKNFEDFPQHRLSFYELLQAVNAHCFKAFLNIPPAQFKLVFDSVVWAFKHTMRNVADMGLNILFKMLQNLDQHPGAAQSFYQTYFTDILMQIFSVVTDTSHTAGLPNHAIILAYMFSLVENRKITVNLGPIPDNMIFIQEYVASLLKSAFNHLSDNQIKVFVTGLFNLDENVQAFKEHLRDFLIQIREATGEDDSDLYLEEREAALAEEQSNKHQMQRNIPGMLNPHELPEDMQDE